MNNEVLKQNEDETNLNVELQSLGLDPDELNSSDIELYEKFKVDKMTVHDLKEH